MPLGRATAPLLLALALALVVALGACAAANRSLAGAPAAPPTGGAGGELVVFAAASLTDPFNELGPLFSAANGGATVTYNFGGTPQLRTQLEQGARADLFASANRDQMAAALASGVVVGETPVFAQNKLVVIVPKANPGKIETIEDLARPGLKLVITQRDVPVGRYTRDALATMAGDARFGAQFETKVLANIRSEEPNVKQLVAKVRLGEADAAIVYSSDVSATVASEVIALPIPDRFNTVADYPIAQVKGAAHPELARTFMAYVISGAGRDVLAKHGFLVAERTALGRVVPHAGRG